MLTENLLLIGMILVFIGILFVITSIFLSAKKKTEGGFVIFVGPIPIVGATTKTMFYAMLIISVTLLLIFLMIK